MESGQKKIQSKLLEHRNKEGKTAFYLAVEHGQNDIVNYFIENFNFVNFFARDNERGCTPLHIAVEKNNFDLVKTLYDLDNKKCLECNYDGQSPFFVAVKV